MATLRLKTLTCWETEDNWGADDAYLKVNGETVWGPTKINDNQDKTVNKDVSFSTKAVIELWDKDDADPDDRLGVHDAWSSEQGKGEQQAYFNSDDCNYRLIYEVV